MRSKRSAGPIPGLVHTSLILPQSLHEGMKAVRLAHRATELSDIRLCRLYRQAIEEYLASPQVLQLLERGRKAQRKRPAAAEAQTQEALCADQ